MPNLYSFGRNIKKGNSLYEIFNPRDVFLSQFKYPSLIWSAFKAVTILKSMRICHVFFDQSQSMISEKQTMGILERSSLPTKLLTRGLLCSNFLNLNKDLDKLKDATTR